MSTSKPSSNDGTGENAAVPPSEPFVSADDHAPGIELQEAMTASSPFQSSSSSAAISSSTRRHRLNSIIQSAQKLLEDIRRSKRVGESSKVFRVYIKGMLVIDENYAKSSVRAAGIGVAICDESDKVLFQTSKLIEEEGMNNRVAAANALIEGLTNARKLGIENVVFYSDDYPLCKMVRLRLSAKRDKLKMLLDKVKILRKEFTKCRPSYVAQNEVKFAYKLAREAIASQTNKHAESSGTEIESCLICSEDVLASQIFIVDGCMHRYCFSCMRQHVKVKLLDRILPKCPHDGCTSVLELDSCQKFLTPKLINIMSEDLMRAAIPMTERIYCPYLKCSALMSKSGILEYSKTIFPDAHNCGVRKCMKCHGLFCVNCEVPWHNNMTCSTFKDNKSTQHAGDVKLKTSADQILRRQCVKCNHMIEPTEGCCHMTCRCGYEFCYICGSECKDKKATCTCLLRGDENIIDDVYDDDDSLGESDEDFDDYFYGYDDIFDSDSDY